MAIFFLVVFGCYIFLVLLLLYGWEISLAKPTSNTEVFKSIAVIVPIRNEALNIEPLIKSLSGIQYPADKLEFIFVDDHSEDNATSMLNAKPLSNSKVLNLGEKVFGKKAALSKGIESTFAEVIVTTDADCLHNPNWLHAINSSFSQPNVNMLVGGVSISTSKSFFSKIQAIEFSSLIGSGCSLLYWKIPAMANGANLSFKRSLFLELKGYEGNEHIPSGDDEYLLRKFFDYDPTGVVFNNHADSVVETSPISSLTNFFRQRIRWAGKWRYQTNVKIKLTAILIFIFQCSWLATMILYVIDRTPLFLVLLLSKASLDAVFLFRVGQFLKVRLALIPFALLQLFYPIYVVFTAIGSLFLSFEWKGRKY